MRTLPNTLADPLLHIFLVVACLVVYTAHGVGESETLAIVAYTPREAAIRTAFEAQYKAARLRSEPSAGSPSTPGDESGRPTASRRDRLRR